MSKYQTVSARHGDNSPRSYLVVWESDGQVSVRAVIDEERKFDAPDPCFKSEQNGGASPKINHLIQTLVLEVRREGNTFSLWGAGETARVSFTMSRAGDCTVSTVDRRGGIGVTAVFTKKERGYRPMKALLGLLAKSNLADPEKDAGKVFEKDRPYIFFE